MAACHFLKLDVEGMEVEALTGAAETVRAFRPVLFVENDRRERSAELVSLLLSWRYRVYWHVSRLFRPDNFAGDQENIFGDICSFNLLCFPAEANVRVEGRQEILSANAPNATPP